MANELVEKAKAGDCDSIRALINQSLRSQGITVKSIAIDNGVLNIELRSLRGEIERSVLERIKLNAERLGIETVESIQVFQHYQSDNMSLASGNRSKISSYVQKTHKGNAGNPFEWLMDQIYGNNSNLKILGLILFFIGFIMMGFGLVYDPSYGDTYNIGAISFKATYTNTGGFISVCGAIFMASARRELG